MTLAETTASAASFTAPQPCPRDVGVGGEAIGRAEPRPVTARDRVLWIDAARGFGIVLVVVGHALGGLIDAPSGAGSTLALRQVYVAIYSFHMPLFLLLAGLLVAGRVERGAGAFVATAVRTVAWPYLLWSAVQLAVSAAAGSLVNRPVGPLLPALLSLPWRAGAQFWFLYALFWLHLTAALVLLRGGPRALLALGVGASLFAAAVPLNPTARHVATSLVWYALGVWLGAERTGQALAWASRGPRAVALPALALGLIAISVALVPADELRSLDASHLASLAWRLPVMPAALAGTFAALAFADTPRLAASSWLRVLGERSMAIYLLHVMFVAGSRIVLTRLHLPPTPLLPLLVLAGIAGPLLVERALRPLGLRRWLGF